MAREACEEFGRVKFTEDAWEQFAARITHVNVKSGAGRGRRRGRRRRRRSWATARAGLTT